MTNDVQYKLRMPKELHLLVQKSCSQSKRSINREMVYRLEQSYRAHEDTELVSELEQALSDNGWSAPMSVDFLKMLMDGWEKVRRAGLLPEVTAQPAGVVEESGQSIGEISVKLDALKDFTAGGMIHAPARRLGRSRHDSEVADSVARNSDTLLDYFLQFPGWEGFLGAMGEAFMREYSARTDEQAGHYAGMMAALSVPLAPRLNSVLSSEQRKGSMRVTVTTADFVMRQLTVSVTGEMPCTDGRYLLIPEAADGK